MKSVASQRIRRGISLQIKVALGLVLMVLAPLLVSSYLIGQIGRVTANFAANDATLRQAPMEKALDLYREFIDTKKSLHNEVAARLGNSARIASVTLHENLSDLLNQEAGLYEIAVVGANGVVVASAQRALPGPRWRTKQVEQALGNGGTLRLAFSVSATLQTDYQQLKETLDESRRVAKVTTALPQSYRLTFLALMAGAALIAAILGVVASTLVTRRIRTLVGVARQVSAGRTEARVALRGRDEMAELGAAINKMLDDISTSRHQIEYLQRIGAWQDVARRLAHEIKNPLTPIQLAVQQCVSTYQGEDTKFKRLLTDTGEIVEEEIAGLRRLVDTFRTLGQLPKVEAAAISLDELIADLAFDPTVATYLNVHAPAAAVTVRADRLLLKRVLVNLIENGIQAGQENHDPRVSVTWSVQSDMQIVIWVDDHGNGVADNARDKIFEPYVTTKATGTGLGLAIAKKIVLEHGGDLAVDAARAPTGGARFVVTLPP
jgi:two-component system, NtrC family, nitrogen regulation sensor histidine kinase NtrY